METITLACLVSSRSDGDNLESAVPVRVGQDQLRPGPVAVHHHLPATLGVELLVHQNLLCLPANIILICTKIKHILFRITEQNIPDGVGCSKPGAIVLVALFLLTSKFNVEENGRPSAPDVTS